MTGGHNLCSLSGTSSHIKAFGFSPFPHQRKSALKACCVHVCWEILHTILANASFKSALLINYACSCRMQHSFKYKSHLTVQTNSLPFVYVSVWWPPACWTRLETSWRWGWTSAVRSSTPPTRRKMSGKLRDVGRSVSVCNGCWDLSSLSLSLSLSPHTHTCAHTHTHIHTHTHRIAMGRICSKFKELFVEIRERASKALFFAKMLSKVRKTVKKVSFYLQNISLVVNENRMCYTCILIGFGDCCWFQDPSECSWAAWELEILRPRPGM